LHDSIQFWMPLCRWGAEFCDAHDWRFACIVALEVCQITSFERILAANPGINVYDITKQCEGSLCYDMSAADKFLNRPEVRAQLGVGDRPWSECDMRVNGDFMAACTSAAAAARDGRPRRRRGSSDASGGSAGSSAAGAFRALARRRLGCPGGSKGSAGSSSAGGSAGPFSLRFGRPSPEASAAGAGSSSSAGGAGSSGGELGSLRGRRFGVALSSFSLSSFPDGLARVAKR
ncbi:Serine carboxypeptidase-like 49, partial [Tetrabaena socialis]